MHIFCLRNPILEGLENVVVTSHTLLQIIEIFLLIWGSLLKVELSKSEDIREKLAGVPP